MKKKQRKYINQIFKELCYIFFDSNQNSQFGVMVKVPTRNWDTVSFTSTSGTKSVG